LLTETSARAWQRRAMFCVTGAIAVSLLMPVASGFAPPLNLVVIVGAGVVSISLALYAMSSYVRGYSATKRETAAGYTTLYGKEFRHLWHLDDKTGDVIRRPEAP
jgi:hypothetical protein